MWVPVKALKLLRNFGHVVSYIYLHLDSHYYSQYHSAFQHYRFRPALENHIESYVAKYCSMSLRRFQFNEPPRLLFEENQNSFINVERIDFSNYSPLCDVPFSKFFPNLKHIQLYIYRTVWDRSILIAIPSMRSLYIYATFISRNRDSNLEENDINELLKLNPQIEELEINLGDGFKDVIFQNFNVNLPMLRKFSLRSHPNNIDQRYHSDSVIDFVLKPSKKLTNISFTFNKLERFKCSFFNDETIASCVFNFIEENKHLKSITLDGLFRGINTSIKKLFQLDSVLTNIEELSIEFWDKSMESVLLSEHILNLFSESQSVKKLTLTSYRKTLENLNDSVKSKIVKQEGNYKELTITLNP